MNKRPKIIKGRYSTYVSDDYGKKILKIKANSISPIMIRFRIGRVF